MILERKRERRKRRKRNYAAVVLGPRAGERLNGDVTDAREVVETLNSYWEETSGAAGDLGRR